MCVIEEGMRESKREGAREGERGAIGRDGGREREGGEGEGDISRA